MRRIPQFVTLLRKTGERWINGEAFRLSAALAFYAVFSLVPLLILLTVFVGFVYSGDTVEQVRAQFAGMVSPEAGDFLAKGVVSAGASIQGGLGYAFIAVIVMLAGVSAFTYQLRNAIETTWDVRNSDGGGIGALLKRRLGTLVLVIAAGVLLQISVVVSSAITIYRQHLSALIPRSDFVWHWVDDGVSFVVVTAIFALIYKLLPDVRILWSDVLAGAIVTAVLFSVGKWGIVLYLSTSSFQSVYGAAGSLMVLLAWLYYSSLILLFGADFTRVWVEARGRTLESRIQAHSA
jgi:membrane protein